MPQLSVMKIIKFILVCFLVGFILTMLGISPTDFWQSTVNLVKSAFENASSLLQWGLIYILVGAAVVVPIYIIILIQRYFSRKSTK